ncbi:MAG: hypothetical protein JXR37_31110 [Kiritimatiellae bacterium]|nr:hypothetical protein [Kiritimatiellia bacterium]
MSAITAGEKGNVMTVNGPVEPGALGRVLMHEHLHCDIFDWGAKKLLSEEKPITAERRAYLMTAAVPYLKPCNEHDCFGFLEVTPAPWRAWPTFYAEAAKAANMHIVLCTGFYRDVEQGTYWVKRPEDSIWPFVREAPVDQLADFCIREITEGVHGTEVRAGAIKLGSSQPEMTEPEKKALRAGARAQKATGVHITTHCTRIGAETAQLELFDKEGVDLSRVAIGHTAPHLMNPESRKTCLEWMKRGANFLPTNMSINEGNGDRWRPLVEAIHDVFDAGYGDHIAGFGLDWAFSSESGPFGPCIGQPPPFLHMYTHTLPAFRKMGLTPEEEEQIMAKSPQRILPVR